MLTRALFLCMAIGLLSGCVYRIDIPQGNYLEQKDIDKLQIGMSKEQVKFVLGNPVLIDAFDENTWNYLYNFTSGKAQGGRIFVTEDSKKATISKKITLSFEQDKLIKAEGDFELKENFYVPIDG